MQQSARMHASNHLFDPRIAGEVIHHPSQRLRLFRRPAVLLDEGTVPQLQDFERLAVNSSKCTAVYS